ncbi:hypothetical protein POKO110462_19280 [Pontibacter korlensis]|uniref:Uncharacterized protein n=1 Tax=Pontibacter korlensis TaxID=400092 RepID=A0A0E3ZG97_9BACT|nr:hypothetical protein [Pontibacter korlensis]AKD04843.1 hypothetical protein PKOR_19210 [Pontibacter korlensis]
MKRFCTAFLVGFIICSAPPAPVWAAGGATSGNNELMQRAEQLLSKYKDSEALLLFEQVISQTPDNLQALCKASVLHSRIGDRYADETRKLEHFSKAKEYAMRAYELNPGDAESNYAMAMALAMKAMMAGPRERLEGINQVKSFADAALVSNGEHAGAWHVLGRWYFKMANLNFAEKAASKVFFGGVCGEASNEKAAEAIAKAVAYAPNNIRYYYDLACVYKEMKNAAACISTLQRALTLTLETNEELELSRRCSIMLQEQQRM